MSCFVISNKTFSALKIQVSPDTYVVLKEKGDLFDFEYRGEIAVKVIK